MKSSSLGLVVLSLCAWSVVVMAQDAPKRKSGKWAIAVATAGQPPITEEVCIDQNSDDIAKSGGSGTQESDCEVATIKKESDTYVTESICRLRNSTMTTRGVFKGSFDAAYSGAVETNYNPPLYGRAQVKSTIEAKLLGPC